MTLVQKLRGQDAFDSLGRESEDRDKRFELGKFKVGRGTPLDVVVCKFEKLLDQRWTNARRKNKGFEQRFYERSLKELSRTLREDISPELVGQFAVVLGGYNEGDEYRLEKQKGLYLSALVAASPHSDFVIPTVHLRKPMDHIGWMNAKNLIINGNAGHVAPGMSAGRLVVNGNVGMVGGHNVPHITGGEIDIYGNVGNEDTEKRVIFGCIGLEKGTVRVHGDLYGGIWINQYSASAVRIDVSGDVHGRIKLGSGELNIGGNYEKIALKRDRSGYKPYYGGFKITQGGNILVHGYEMNVPEAKIQWEI